MLQATASREPARRRQVAVLSAVLTCLLGLGFSACFVTLNRTGLGIDFNQFYCASRLAGTGHLYDWDALRALEVQNGIPIPTGRLPVVIYGFKLLGLLPYGAARSVWMAASIAALIVFAAVWPGARRLFMLVALLWSVPVSLVLLFGQDVPFWLMFFAGGLLLLERKRPWAAGVAFSLCLCKYHLALGIPVMLAARRSWTALIAGAAATAAWIGCSFLIEGPQWPRAYVDTLQMPGFSPASARMPNIHGLAFWLPWPVPAEIVGAIALVWMLWLACRRNPGVGMAGAAAAAGGLLLGNHSYAGDCALLIPLAVLTVQKPDAPRWLKAWALLILPAAPLLLMSLKPAIGQALVASFVVTVIALEIVRRPQTV